MTRDELEKRNVGENLDTLMNLDPRGYGVCRILYAGSRKATGEPLTMQQAPVYADVVSDVHEFLTGRVRECLAAGVSADRLVLDPGFGFGKTLEHNLTMLRRLAEFRLAGLPVLAGMSRKSMFGMITGRPDRKSVV